jgi:ribonuclease HII
MLLTHEASILGVDEVGRGPLAGPVVAAAVILLESSIEITIKDSKLLSEKSIMSTASLLKGHCYYSIAEASVKEIDELNILQATMLAMRRAIDKIKANYALIKIDGNCNPFGNGYTKDPIELVIGGDGKSRSIAAASILAKDYRDSLMRDMHNNYPYYNWFKNKGYGSKEHIDAIKIYGTCNLHRQSFCKKYI